MRRAPSMPPARLSAERVAKEARQFGGLVLAAHVERRAHGLLGVLGFQPPDLELDGLEAGPGELTQGRVAGSDAHRLADMGRRFTVFETERASVEDLRRCLQEGRYRAGYRAMKELSLHLLDLIENSVAAGATWVELAIEENVAADRLVISVADNGRGMSEEMVAAGGRSVLLHAGSTRKIGMGLALLSAAAEQAGGKMRMWSLPDKGTQVMAEFVLSHLDRAPLGRIEDTLATVAVLHPELDLHFVHTGPDGQLLAGRPGNHRGDAGQTQARQEIVQRVQEARRRIGSVA